MFSSNSDFQRWYNDADMPEKVNGQWVDLETGIPYRSEVQRTPAERRGAQQQNHGDAIVRDRLRSKELKLPALTGSVAQKDWAVQIRLKTAEQMSPALLASLCSVNNPEIRAASFWINNRNRQDLKQHVEQMIIGIA